MELPAGTVADGGVTAIVVNTAAGLVVVRVVLLLIPCDEAVIVVVPPVGPPAPMASPPPFMVATAWLLLANVNVIPLSGFPYWSIPLAANCWELVVRMDGFAGVKMMFVNAGGGGSTVNNAGALVTPSEVATMLAVPGHTPVAEATLSVTQLLLVAHVNPIPVMGLLY